MLKFNSEENKKSFFNVENKEFKTFQTYLDEELLPTILSGDWDKLNEMEIFPSNSDTPILFKQDRWNLRGVPSLTEQAPPTLSFNITEHRNDNRLGKGRKLELNLCRQIKAIVLCMFYEDKEVGLDVVRGYCEALTKFAVIMLNNGLNDISELTTELIVEWSADNDEFYGSEKKTSALSVLPRYDAFLPFTIEDISFTRQMLHIDKNPSKQHLVIPPRIYTHYLNDYISNINATMPHLEELTRCIERVLGVAEAWKIKIVSAIRSGEKTVEDLLLSTQGKPNYPQIVIGAFKKANIELVDNFEEEKWLELFNSLAPTFKDTSHKTADNKFEKEPLAFGGKSFKTMASFKTYIRELDCECKATVLLLSGMRTDELNSMSPVFGAQKEIINKQTIYLFTTRQSKIVPGTQTKEDIFVTTENGHRAFLLLNTINNPYRKRLPKSNINIFPVLSSTTYIKGSLKSVWASALRTNLNKGYNLVLSKEDIMYLNTSNPSQDKYTEGSTIIITLHQFRRSFSYYLIGFELLSFPQLKKQLSHLSGAMTRHYSKNASKFSALQKEINTERTRQKSIILADIYKKIANNERIGGGKGKALLKIAGKGTNYFEQSENKRKMEPSYWAKLINDKSTHIHAIAPGMYCTNNKCSMRIEIELAECVECEFDIIDSVIYAEGVRLNAMKNMLALEANNEMTHNILSQLTMKIRSSEKILSDLSYDFEPFKFPESVMNTIIDTNYIQRAT